MGGRPGWFYLQERFERLRGTTTSGPTVSTCRCCWPTGIAASASNIPTASTSTATRSPSSGARSCPPRFPTDPAVYYLMAMADNQGRPLEPGRTYKVVVPARMPIKQFWQLTPYDRATMAFIYTESMRTTLDSYAAEQMTKNAEGGVTIYVGPEAPAGLEANWIPTGGKRPLPAFRFYGPDEPFYPRTFKMPDFERVG